MLLSARPRRLALVSGLCAGIIGAATTAGVLAAATGALDGSSPPSASTISPAAIVQGYDAGITTVIRKASIDEAVPRGATIVVKAPPTLATGATVIQVRGSVVAQDAQRDLALVSVDPKGLSPMTVAARDELALGQRVIAIGNAFGLTGAPSVTSGVVSGYCDLIAEGRQFRHLIQTDTPINLGNSGGPLIDTSGRLVGITTLAATAGEAEDIGFAIAAQALALIERANH